MAKIQVKTIEQRLSAKGYTQQEIDDLKPLLTNTKFRNDLETELNMAEQASSDLNDYDNWFTKEITPEHEALIKRAEDAEAEAAAAKARMEFWQKKGMDKQGDQQLRSEADRTAEAARKAREDAGGKGNSDMSKYVSTDVFKDAFERAGEAIADATDLVADFGQLYPGQRLNMKAMRDEAKAAKMPVRAYVENKYSFATKRAELERSARQKEIDDAVKAKEQELILKFAGSNPNLAVGSQSPSPLVARKQQDKDAKQPWELNDSQLTKERVQKAIEKAAGRGELARA